jgi:hypothetical protein
MHRREYRCELDYYQNIAGHIIVTNMTGKLVLKKCCIDSNIVLETYHLSGARAVKQILIYFFKF